MAWASFSIWSLVCCCWHFTAVGSGNTRLEIAIHLPNRTDKKRSVDRRSRGLNASQPLILVGPTHDLRPGLIRKTGLVCVGWDELRPVSPENDDGAVGAVSTHFFFFFLRSSDVNASEWVEGIARYISPLLLCVSCRGRTGSGRTPPPEPSPDSPPSPPPIPSTSSAPDSKVSSPLGCVGVCWVLSLVLADTGFVRVLPQRTTVEWCISRLTGTPPKRSSPLLAPRYSQLLFVIRSLRFLFSLSLVFFSLWVFSFWALFDQMKAFDSGGDCGDGEGKTLCDNF